MSFLNALNISGSAMTAQRMRLDIISENISHIDTTRTEGGGPYRRKIVEFQAADSNQFKSTLATAMGRKIGGSHAEDAGVIVSNIIEDETPFKTIYDPTHPDADQYGYVQMPNVELLKEMVDSMSASRSYEANVTAINSIKLMASKALEVGR